MTTTLMLVRHCDDVAAAFSMKTKKGVCDDVGYEDNGKNRGHGGQTQTGICRDLNLVGIILGCWCIAEDYFLVLSPFIDQAPDVDVLLADADGTFHSMKALSQSDGRSHYSSDNPESSAYAARNDL